MEEIYIEFEEPSSIDRALNKKSSFRKEFRIPVMEDEDISHLQITIENKNFDVSNISSSGFQILTKDSIFNENDEDNEVIFEIFYNNVSISGRCCIKYVEKWDLERFAIGMKIISFLKNKHEYFNLLKHLNEKIINGKLYEKE